MDITIKQRDIMFCNIKVLLMFLVVYGHFIENGIDDSPILMLIYKLIYTIHMPMFVFISGYFVKTAGQCLNQAKKAFKVYIIWQLTMYILINYLRIPIYVGNTRTDELLMNTPFWHLWYLLSMTCWTLAGFVILKYGKRFKIIVIIATVIIACLAGGDDSIGREYSLSRTLVFLPYFLAGVFIPKNIEWHRYRKCGISALALGLMIFKISFGKIDYWFLWQAEAYDGKLSEGIILRLTCYLMAVLFGFFIITNVPKKRFGFSKAGADTMNIYIWHGFIVMALGRADLYNVYPVYLGVVAAGLSVAVIYSIYKLFKWSGQMYSLPELKKEAAGKETAYGGIQGHI